MDKPPYHSGQVNKTLNGANTIKEIQDNLLSREIYFYESYSNSDFRDIGRVIL